MRRLPSILTCLLLILQSFLPAIAQMPDYHVRLFDESFGIRSVGLRKMTRDKKGFVWLVYNDRIKRFDGKQIKDFFPGERLSSVLCDGQNQLWISSVTKLFKFENDHTGFRVVEVDTAGSLQLGAVFQLPGQPVWLLTSRGFYAWNPTVKKFTPLKESLHKAPFSFNIQQYSLSTYHSVIFYCADKYVYRRVTEKNECDSLPVSEIFSVNALNERQALVTNWKNQSFLYDFPAQKIHPISIRRHLPYFTDDFLTINDVLNLDTNSHLLATSKGMMEYNSTTGRFVMKKLFFKGQPLLNQDGLVDLYQDNDRRIWACNDYSLLSFKPREPGIGLIRNWETDPAKTFSNHIRGFAPDEKDNLWLATINGIAYFDIEKGTIKPFFPVEGATNQMNHPSIRGILYDGRYVIIGQTNRGIWLYEPATGRYKRPLFQPGPAGDTIRRQLENDFIDQLYTLHNGHHIVTARDRCYLVNGKNYMVNVLNFPGSHENLNFCYEDNKKQIWMGTGKGLHCLDSNLVPLFSVKAGITAATRCLYQLSAHEYLLGTKGLYLLNTAGEKPVLKKVTSYFDNVLIQTIYQDSTRLLWLATNDGLYRYHLPSQRVDYFDPFDNIQGNFYYQNSFYLNRRGLLFLGGFNGINYFKPETIKVAADSLQVSVTRIRVNDDDTSYVHHTGTYRLRYFQNSVDIDFVAPWFSNTGRVQYRYRLKGLNNNWINSGNSNTARFSSLPPGHYTFTAAASVDGKRWFETEMPFSFNISPPFWSTWWFRLLMMVALALVLYKWIQSLREKIMAEKVLNYFATSLYGQNTVEDVFWDVAKNCMSQLQFEDCVIYEYDEQRKVLVQKAAYGPKNPGKHEIYNPLEIPLGQGIVGAVAQSGKAEIVHNTLKDSRYILDDQRRLSEIAIPIMADGKLIGIIDSEHPRKSFYTKRHLNLLSKIADTCAAKISKYMVEEKLRSKIARDLHDEMGSTLTSINIISKVALQQLPPNPDIQNHLQRIKDHSARMMESMSDIVWAINPANDAFEQIIIRLKELAAEMLEPVRINYFFNEDEQLNYIKLNPEQRKDIYLIYKECINNTVKYSEATEIHIILRRENAWMKMQITDNGKGFDAGKTHSGNGIKNMQSRAAELQATLKIDSIRGTGTTVLLQLPVSHHQGI